MMGVNARNAYNVNGLPQEALKALTDHPVNLINHREE